MTNSYNMENVDPCKTNKKKKNTKQIGSMWCSNYETTKMRHIYTPKIYKKKVPTTKLSKLTIVAHTNHA